MTTQLKVRYTVSQLRKMLGSTPWSHFKNPNGDEKHNGWFLNGIHFRVKVGPHLGRPALVCMAQGKFVAIRYFVLTQGYSFVDKHTPPDPLRPETGQDVEAWGSWHTAEFDPNEPIVKGD